MGAPVPIVPDKLGVGTDEINVPHQLFCNVALKGNQLHLPRNEGI